MLAEEKTSAKKHLCPGNGECGEGGEGRWAGAGVGEGREAMEGGEGRWAGRGAGEGREAMHTIIVFGSRVVSIGTDVHTSIRIRSHPCGRPNVNVCAHGDAADGRRSPARGGRRV